MNKSASIPSIKLVEVALMRTGIAPGNGPVVAGVSGGLDSMVLWHMLLKLGFEVTAVHVNYGKRGADSDADQQIVDETANAWGTAVQIFQADLTDRKGNFQALARDFRYQKFQEVADAIGAQAVATAHHRHDRLETILMRVLRGASPTSWDALREWNQPFIRPMLDLDRNQILKYAQTEGVPWRDDKSNFADDYARNLLRNQIVPQIDELLPGWQRNLERLPQFGEIYTEALDALLGDVRSGLQLDRLAGKSSALQNALLHRYLIRQNVTVSNGQLRSLLNLQHSQKGRRVALPQGLWLIREADSLIVAPDSPVNEAKFNVKAPVDPNWEGWEVPFGRIGWTADCENTAGYRTFCIRKPRRELVVRPWKAGDRIVAISAGVGRKVSDMLTDWKVPTRLRGHAWVVALDGKPVACIFAHQGEKLRFAVSDYARRTEGDGIRIDIN